MFIFLIFLLFQQGVERPPLFPCVSGDKLVETTDSGPSTSNIDAESTSDLEPVKENQKSETSEEESKDKTEQQDIPEDKPGPSTEK